MLKRLNILLFFVVYTLGVTAQDAHVSQFFQVPILSNPSFSGLMKESWRISSLYRDQWSGIGTQYNTSILCIDANIQHKKLLRDRIGVSCMLFNDKQGEGIITTNSVNLGLAYHHPLDRLGKHNISIGGQALYSQKKIDLSNLSFGNQYINFVYDPNAPNQEQINGNRISYLNASVGAAYRYNIAFDSKLILGYSLSNLLRPNESIFIPDSTRAKNTLSFRHNVYAAWLKKVGHRFWIMPVLQTSVQSNALNLSLGPIFIWELSPTFQAKLGTWYRFNSAAIVGLGFKYKSLDMMFSYDMASSKSTSLRGQMGNFSTALPTPKVGAWEISLIISGIWNRNFPSQISQPCTFF